MNVFADTFLNSFSFKICLGFVSSLSKRRLLYRLHIWDAATWMFNYWSSILPLFSSISNYLNFDKCMNALKKSGALWIFCNFSGCSGLVDTDMVYTWFTNWRIKKKSFFLMVSMIQRSYGWNQTKCQWLCNASPHQHQVQGLSRCSLPFIGSDERSTRILIQ